MRRMLSVLAEAVVAEVEPEKRPEEDQEQSYN
jgi:hypothetical protein